MQKKAQGDNDVCLSCVFNQIVKCMLKIHKKHMD